MAAGEGAEDTDSIRVLPVSLVYTRRAMDRRMQGLERRIERVKRELDARGEIAALSPENSLLSSLLLRHQQHGRSCAQRLRSRRERCRAVDQQRMLARRVEHRCSGNHGLGQR